MVTKYTEILVNKYFTSKYSGIKNIFQKEEGEGQDIPVLEREAQLKRYTHKDFQEGQ